jgi:DNA-binding MurR/RpiR family transcriptional regulator
VPFNALVAEIVSHYNQFTKVERVIADYFINNTQIEDFSMQAMKERLYVSEASFSRFSQKLGFRGYREFISAYTTHFSKTPRSHSLKKQSVLSLYEELLQTFSELIDDEEITAVASEMLKAKRILIVGIGSSGLAAEEMKRRFIRIGLVTESCDQPDMMRMQSIFTDDQTFVIALSVSGQQEVIDYVLRQAHARHAKTLLISGAEKTSPAIDYQIRVPVMKNMDAGHLISPQFPLLVVGDLIYHQCLKLNSDMQGRHRKTLAALKEK